MVPPPYPSVLVRPASLSGCRRTGRACGGWGRRVAPIVLGLLMIGGAARAQAVAVVRTADGIPIFEQAIDRLKKDLDDVQVDSLDADPDRWRKVHDRLSRKTPAVWVPVGPLALSVAVAEGSARPIVFMMVPAPDEASLAGGSVAGVTLRVDSAVQLREIRTLLPDARRLGIVHDPAQSGAEVAAARRAAAGAGVTLEVVAIDDTSELGGALQELLAKQIDAVWLVPDRTVTPPRQPEVIEFLTSTAAKAGVPVVGYAEKLTQRGALFSLAPDYAEVGTQASEMIQRVLAGESPASVGIQDARATALSVNLKVAGTLGIELPDDVEQRAASVFR